MSTREHPKRKPPPVIYARAILNGQPGERAPIPTQIFMECGQTVELRGIGWVQCVRRAGHPVTLTVAHSNGLGDEWCFDADGSE